MDDLLSFCLESLCDLKAHDLISIDVKGQSSIADYMIVCSGTSNRHVSAIADRLSQTLYEHGLKEITISGQELGQWVVVDTGSVMIHIMQPEYRERYALEDLYRCMAAADNLEVA
ncbi:MAG: ribosome silencing factor [Succinivibrio sp.]|nr:ribosome silencing factor [Succinivibrio sp.]